MWDKARLAAGVRPKSVKDKSLDPVVSYGSELAPTSKYIWEALEDMEAKDCIAKGVEIDAWRPLRKPKCGKVKDIKPEQIAFDTIWNQEAADPLTPIGHGKCELITGVC